MATDFLTYSLKTALCITVFYLFFKLLLSRETFHAFNRRLVLAATAVSFVLPLCVITVRRTLPAPQVRAEAAVPIPHAAVAPATAVPEPAGGTEPLAAVPTDSLSAAAADTAPVTKEPAAAVTPAAATNGETRGFDIPWRQVAGVTYLLGVTAVAGLTLRSVMQLRRLTRRGRREKLDNGTTLVRVDGDVTPISWWRNIVISERDLTENGEAILAHERAHIRLRHSLDLLLIDLAGAVQWFNPAMWLLRRDLRAIHEYEADAAVIASGVDARSYQLLLIRKAVGGRWYSIANSFNHSKLKNRITMMSRKKSSQRTRAHALLLLPLAGLALGAFAETVYVRADDKVTKEFSETIPSGRETAVVETSDPMQRDNPDRSGSNAAAPDTIRRHSRGETTISGDDDARPAPEQKERIRAYFESDEWKQAQQELEKLGEYFESDEWREAVKKINEQGAKMEEYFNGGEWRQKQQELEKLGEYFESDEWKQAVKKMTEQGAKMEEYINSDEWKQKAKELEEYFNSGEWRQKQQELAETAAEMKAYFESDDWRHTQQLMSEAAAKMEEYFNSDEWKQQQQELEKLDEYFDSDEWREAWKHAEQATRSGDDDYFQSDEWKQIKRKLDEWRAAHDESGMPEWVIEARRDMERNRETLRQDMAETRQRIMEMQQKIARTQDAIQQSGDNDRPTRREMEKTHKELARAKEELAQAREEIEQALQEAEQIGREVWQIGREVWQTGREVHADK